MALLAVSIRGRIIEYPRVDSITKNIPVSGPCITPVTIPAIPAREKAASSATPSIGSFPNIMP